MAKAVKQKGAPAEPVLQTGVNENTSTPVATEKSNKSGLRVLLIVLIILLFLCGLCGLCGLIVKVRMRKEYDRLYNGLYSNHNSITETNDSSAITLTPTSTFLYGKNAKLPADFPTDVPIYPDSELGAVTSGGKDEASMKYIVTFGVAEEEQKVVDFYKKEISAKGWSVTNETHIFGTVLDAKKDQRTLNIFIYGKGKETQITITASK